VGAVSVEGRLLLAISPSSLVHSCIATPSSCFDQEEPKEGVVRLSGALALFEVFEPPGLSRAAQLRFFAVCVYLWLPLHTFLRFGLGVYMRLLQGSISTLQIDSHRTSSRGFRRSRLQWQSQSPSQQWCILLVAESKYYFFRNLLWTAAPVLLAVAVTISTMVSASGG